MKSLFQACLFCLLFSVNCNAAILVFTGTGTTSVYTTKLTLEAARTSADCAGKNVVVTSDLTQAQSNISGAWPTDRKLKFEGGSIANSTAFTINSIFNSDRNNIFKGSGQVYFGKGSTLEVYPEWWGGFNTSTGTGDAGIAINKAISAIAQSFTTSRLIKLSGGVYNVTTPIDLTSTAFEKSYTQIVGVGLSTNIQADTGSRLFDCVGTNHLTFKDFYVVPGANCSTIGFLFWRGLADNFCHLNVISGVKLELKSMHTVNGGRGSIGILNVEGEDHTYFNIYMGCNSPVVLERCGGLSSLGFTPISYVALQTTPTSFGTVTFGGKNSLISFRNWQPGLYINGVNSLDLGATHIGGGPGSAWDSDSDGSYAYAIGTGTNSCNVVRHFGLVEGHAKYLKLGTTLVDFTGQVFMADSGSSSGAFIDIGAYALINSNISFVNGNATRLPLVSGTGALQQTHLKGYNTLRYLTPELALNALNSSVTTDGNVMYYDDKVQRTQIHKTALPSIIDYIDLPIIVAGNNAGVLNYTLNGSVTTLNTNNQATAPASIDFTSSLNVVSNLNGTYTIGTGSTVLGTLATGGTTTITGAAISGSIVGNNLQITLTPSGANLSGVYVTATRKLQWDGFSTQAPQLQ